MLLFLLFAALPTNDDLANTPEVASVTVQAVQNPTHRIIHVLNWHFVSREDFALEGDSDAYEAFLDDVEAVQVEQMTFLKRLGVKKVSYEGLTPENHPAYVKRAATLQKLHRPDGDGGIDLLLKGFIREDTLQLGAAGRMLMAGQIEQVSPAEDEELLDKANPVRDGKLVFDETANKAREDAVVRLLLQERESVLIMGGSHDLTDNVPDGVEYLRVVLKRYQSVLRKGDNAKETEKP